MNLPLVVSHLGMNVFGSNQMEEASLEKGMQCTPDAAPLVGNFTVHCSPIVPSSEQDMFVFLPFP